MAIDYNPGIIHKFALRLYARANSIVRSYSLAGAVLGAAGGGYSGTTMDMMSAGIVIGALTFGLLGYAIGSERALSLRVQAQMLLCQMNIEANTRHLAYLPTGDHQGNMQIVSAETHPAPAGELQSLNPDKED